MTKEEALAIVTSHTRHLISKWEKTGLFDDTKHDVDKSHMAVLIESKSKQLIDPFPTDLLEQALKILNL